MTYEMYRYVFLGGAIACGVLFAVTVALFFLLRIPKVVSDLSGRTAKKAIEDIRRQNEQSGDKTYRSSAVNLERGKLTDKITKSGRLQPREQSPFGTGTITEKISTQKLPAESAETTVLPASEETTVLQTPEALTPAIGETTVLEAGETTLLTETAAPTSAAFSIAYEITFLHTEEIIS